jgi:hypothetical protein
MIDMKKKSANITREDEHGNIIKRIPMTEADDDWIRAGRLKRKADEGDKEAAKKLKKMESTQMFTLEDDDEQTPQE